LIARALAGISCALISYLKLSEISSLSGSACSECVQATPRNVQRIQYQPEATLDQFDDGGRPFRVTNRLDRHVGGLRVSDCFGV
jgi:hypothetical protein